MDFGFLAVPIYMALIAFGFAVFTDTQTVNIEYVDVPESIAAETGYTSPVLVTRLADEMQLIAKKASTKAEVRQVELHEEKKPVAVLSEFVGLTPLVRVVQEFGVADPLHLLRRDRDPRRRPGNEAARL